MYCIFDETLTYLTHKYIVCLFLLYAIVFQQVIGYGS